MEDIFMRKFMASLMIGGVLLLAGCSNGTTTNQINADDKKSIETALENLQGYEGAYAITNLLEAPDGTINYIEVCTGGASYTEYPCDEEGNIGMVAYDQATSYMLSDWLTSSNEFYIMDSDENGNLLSVTLPTSYADLCDSREYLYLDLMIDEFTSIKKVEDQVIDGETITVYECKLPASVTKKILGVGYYGLYHCIRTDNPDDANVVALADYYCDELDMSLACSDSIVSVGVSADGLLKYVSMEIGGLGTRMFYTKVVATDGVTVRTEPDFSNTGAYMDTFKELADYYASFDSIEEGMDFVGSTDIPVIEDTTEEATSTDSTEADTEATTEGTETSEE